MLEKKIEDTVCRYAKGKGFLTPKFTSPNRAAVPDRIFIFSGVIVFVEFKATGKTPTPAQEREHARLRDAGATVFVVDNIDQGKLVVDAIALGLPIKKSKLC